MVDSMCIHKPININIGTVTKNIKMPKNAVKKLSFVIRDMFLINIRSKKCVIELF